MFFSFHGTHQEGKMVVVFLLPRSSSGQKDYGWPQGTLPELRKKNLSVAADQDNEKNLYLPSRSGVLSTETRNIFSEPDARRVLVYKRNLVQMMYSSFL